MNYDLEILKHSPSFLFRTPDEDESDPEPPEYNPE